MTTDTFRAPSLAALLEPGPISRIVGARDSLTAILAAEAGFDGIWISSFEISASKGLPDLGLLTLTECLNCTLGIAHAVSIPALVDCDTGYGGLMNVRRTVHEFAAVGVPGVCFEDKTFPKRNSFLSGPQNLVPKEYFARVIETARLARGASPMTIVARLESLVAGSGPKETLDRAHTYADAGADAVLIHSKASHHHEVADFLASWKARLPVVIVPTTYNRWTATDAGDAGASIVIYANHGLRAAVTATRGVFSRILRDDSSLIADADIASVADILTLTGAAEWEKATG